MFPILTSYTVQYINILHEMELILIVCPVLFLYLVTIIGLNLLILFINDCFFFQITETLNSRMEIEYHFVLSVCKQLLTSQ